MSEGDNAWPTLNKRPYKEVEDRNFLFSTWSKGAVFGQGKKRILPYKSQSEAIRHFHTRIESILSMEGVEVTLACLKDDEDTIVGYAVTSPKEGIIHWVFVRGEWRRSKIAEGLIGDLKAYTHCTHMTSGAAHILRHKGHKLKLTHVNQTEAKIYEAMEKQL